MRVCVVSCFCDILLCVLRERGYLRVVQHSFSADLVCARRLDSSLPLLAVAIRFGRSLGRTRLGVSEEDTW